jgi:hypothetical protein
MKRDNELILGLVRCTNMECQTMNYKKKKERKYKHIIWNRDMNAVKNMVKIIRNIMKEGERLEK